MYRLSILLLAAGAACAADRPDLNGTWQFDAAHSDVTDARLKSERLFITQKDNSVEISEAATESNGKERKSDMQCNVEGQECSIKDNGQPAKISFYYNGPILVVTEMRHGKDFVVKKRLKPSDDGKTLRIEVIHLAPAGQKNETYTFTREQTATPGA